jgi:FAD synthetase
LHLDGLLSDVERNPAPSSEPRNDIVQTGRYVARHHDKGLAGELAHRELAAVARQAMARRQGRPGVHLSVVIARDDSVRRIKHRSPHHTQRERCALMAAVRLVDEAFVGAPNDFIASVRRVNPDLIVLGHDQKAGWEDTLHAAGIYAKILRCPPYERHRLTSTVLRSDLERMST